MAANYASIVIVKKDGMLFIRFIGVFIELF